MLIVLVLRRFAGTRTPTRCYGFTYEIEYEYESREAPTQTGAVQLGTAAQFHAA